MSRKRDPGLHTRALGRTDVQVSMLALNFTFDACHEVMPQCATRGMGIIWMNGCGGDGRMLTELRVSRLSML